MRSWIASNGAFLCLWKSCCAFQALPEAAITLGIDGIDGIDPLDDADPFLRPAMDPEKHIRELTPVLMKRQFRQGT